MIVKTETIDGKLIEVHEDRYGARRYWVAVDGRGLYQHGRMRVRSFSTVEAARKAAIKDIQS